MIISTNVSNFVKKICWVLTILHQHLYVGVSLILGHGVYWSNYDLLAGELCTGNDAI